MIRRATMDDEPAILSCAEQAYSKYIPLIGRKPAPMLADFASQIAAGQVHIAFQGESSFQGYVVCYAEDDFFMLESVAVLPRFTGQGVGKALITFCEQMAKVAGKKAVQLYTNEKMIENISIYKKLGYIEIERRREDGFNRVFFSKQLT